MNRGTALALALLILAGPARAQDRPGQRADHSDPEAWITLRDFRYVTAVAAGDAYAYVGTTGGVERFDTLRDEWLSPVTEVDGLPDARVTALGVDPAGDDLWVGTARGLVRFLPHSGEIEPVFGPPPARVDALWVEPDPGTVHARVAGVWWSGSVGGPVLERSEGPPRGRAVEGAVAVADVDPRDLPWTDPLYVASPDVPGGIVPLTVFDRDRRGDWYVGTWGDNARRWGAGFQSWESLRFGLAGPPGGPIVRAADGTWFFPRDESTVELEGTATADEAGVRMAVAVSAAPTAIAHADLNGRWLYVVPGRSPAPAAVAAAAALAIGDTLYAGTVHGLQRKAGDVWTTWGPADDPRLGPVTALAQGGGRLWIGTESGLLTWDRAAARVTEHALRGRAVRAIAVGPDVVYAGTEAGLHAARIGTGGAVGAFAPLGSGTASVRALALRDSLLIVATHLGLDVVDRALGTRNVTLSGAGRIPGEPLALAVDGENVWIGTTEALVRWVPSTDEWRAYTPADGLAGVPVRHLLAEERAVWSSTPWGATRFAWEGED